MPSPVRAETSWGWQAYPHCPDAHSAQLGRFPHGMNMGGMSESPECCLSAAFCTSQHLPSASRDCRQGHKSYGRAHSSIYHSPFSSYMSASPVLGRPKPGVWHSIQHGWQIYKYLSHLLLFFPATLVGCLIGSRAANTGNSSHRGCWHSR